MIDWKINKFIQIFGAPAMGFFTIGLINWLDFVIPSEVVWKLIFELLLTLVTLGYLGFKLYREVKEALKDNIITEAEFQQIVQDLQLTQAQAALLWNILKKFSKK